MYLRLCRASTDSWLTVRCPYRLETSDEIDLWCLTYFPNWEYVSGCPVNPDES